MTPNDIEKLQKECDFEYMKEKIEKQQTQINSLINKEETAVVEPNYKEEYYKLQEENCMLKGKIKEYQEALLRICINK